MKTYTLTIIITVSFFYLSQSQVLFSNQYDYANRLELISDVLLLDSSYLLVGGNQTPYTSESNRLFISIDKEGNKIWEKSIYPGDDRRGLIRHIERLDDTFSIIQGTEELNSQINWSNLFLTKVNHNNGDTIWTKYYGSYILSERTGKMIRTSDGGFVIAGWVFREEVDNNSLPQYNTRFLLIKTDSLGNELFQKHYTVNDTTQVTGMSLVETPDSGFLMVGRYSHLIDGNTISAQDLTLIKVDNEGNEEWAISHPADAETRVKLFTDIIATPDSNYIICGTQEHWILGTFNRSWRYALKKISTEGEIIWEKEYEQNRVVYWNRIRLTSRNTYILCGYETDPPASGWNNRYAYAVISEVDSDGELLWHRKYKSSPDDLYFQENFYSVKETPDGGFIAVGRSYGTPEDSTYQNAWVIKTDSLGCVHPEFCDSIPVIDCDSIGIDICDTTMVNVDVQYLNPAKAGDLFMSPNPSPGILRIWVARERVRLVSIFDLSGRLLFSKRVEQAGIEEALLLDLGHFAAGMYVVQVETNMGIRTGKWVRR